MAKTAKWKVDELLTDNLLYSYLSNDKLMN